MARRRPSKSEAVAHCPLFRLPAELRNQIYREVLIEEERININSGTFHKPGIIRCCRAINDEAWAIYFSENRFELVVDDYNSDPLVYIADWLRERRMYLNLKLTVMHNNPNARNLALWLNRCHRGLVKVHFTPEEEWERSTETKAIEGMFRVVRETKRMQWSKVEAMLTPNFHILHAVNWRWEMTAWDKSRMDSSNATSGDSPPSQKRQRAKQACEPCRLRKRRCDGNMPCNMCTQFEYKCYFEKHPRKRSKLVEQDAVENGIVGHGDVPKTTPPRDERPSQEDVSKLRSMEANSGIAFTRLLGMRLDASAGPKLFTFGWNLGTGSKTVPITTPITDFLTKEQMVAMAKLFFQQVHPLYGMIDTEWFMKQLVQRYTKMRAVKCPDHLMASVAAIGALFSNGQLDAVLPALVDSAKTALETTSTMAPCTIYDVQSWVLRMIYLRATGHPHACWLAGSMTMHLIESCGLQQDSTNNPAVYQNAGDHMDDPETRRRTFWCARMLNTWVSFEYGRSRVALRGITCQLPVRREGDFTREYIDLYSISCCLDPEVSDKPSHWEDFLRQLERYDAPHDCIELSRANLGLCAYRRLRLANPNVPTENVNRIIHIGLGGLQAARNLATKGLPWWHVANVPFQVICVFLAIDSKESLSHIADAIRTMEMVVERFKTVAMKEALKTARFLIRLSKRKKDEDSDVLGHSLQRTIDGVETRPATPKPPQQNTQQQPMSVQPQSALDTQLAPLQTNGVPQMQPMMQQQQQAPAFDDKFFEQGPMTTSSGEDWNMDYLNNTDFDWNFFLSQDIPAFNNLAPDGMM